MLRTISQIVYERLKATITDTAVLGGGVKVWHEERPPAEARTYLTYSVDTSLQTTGTAQLYELIVEATCYADTAANVGLLADTALAALNDYQAVKSGVRVAGLECTGTQRAYEDESRIWMITLRWQGLALV